MNNKIKISLFMYYKYSTHYYYEFKLVYLSRHLCIPTLKLSDLIVNSQLIL